MFGHPIPFSHSVISLAVYHKGGFISFLQCGLSTSLGALRHVAITLRFRMPVFLDVLPIVTICHKYLPAEFALASHDYLADSLQHVPGFFHCLAGPWALSGSVLCRIIFPSQCCLLHFIFIPSTCLSALPLKFMCAPTTRVRSAAGSPLATRMTNACPRYV